jgi:two-component system NtrC family sensor kinase
MSADHSNDSRADCLLAKSARDFLSLSRQILALANRGLIRIEFLRQVAVALIEFSECDRLELRLVERGKLYRCQICRQGEESFLMDTLPSRKDASGTGIPCIEPDSDLERICEGVVEGNPDRSLPFFTENGSFWTGNSDEIGWLDSSLSGAKDNWKRKLTCDFASLAVIPIAVEKKADGLLILKSSEKNRLTPDIVESYEEIARILGMASSHRRAQVALRERFKELECLYGIAKVAALPGISLESILRRTAELLPPGWLYPEIAAARIVMDGRPYLTPGFRDGLQGLKADVVANGEVRGSIEVAYVTQMPGLDEGPFLKEERNLIDAVAGELALIIERRQAEEEKEKLQEQLRHADRLATIGQLAAGVAHELNEPLGNILGFAQLAQKASPEQNQVTHDLGRIEAASLHAREVVRKLMLFARQAPPRKAPVNLNRIIEDALYFLESRCAKAGIEMEKELAHDLPEIAADPGQIYQILVNLVVNAIQAMPEGGHLSVRTDTSNGGIVLVVRDTGVGMEEDVLKKIFVPFFTTKDVDEGTGLGLSVVHGIVKSHGGTISADSKIGQGSRFTVFLPVMPVEESQGAGRIKDDEKQDFDPGR